MKKVFLCAINNILSGNCSEDCSFCTQSGHFNVPIDKYKFKPKEQILQEAIVAKSHGAIGYCLVTAGRGLDDKKTQEVAQIAKYLKENIDGLNLIACCGIATKEQLLELKSSGVDSYNHNLESSQSYYKKICSTHLWSDRYKTCQMVKEVGLNLCCGGIYGMGESSSDRESLIEAIVSLNPESTPINYFIPNPLLPLENNIDFKQALTVIKSLKSALPKSRVMVAGGREQTFNTLDKERQMYSNGVDAIVIGDYLTTSGRKSLGEIDRLKDLNIEIAKSCNE